MIIFLLWKMDGIVVVSIKGKFYTYQVDAAMIPEWQRRAARTPGKVFNEVKRLGTLVIGPREDSENTRCSLSSLNADSVLQRKDNTMAKGMNWKDLRSAYRSANYSVISGDTDAKGRSYPVCEVCPDCKEVYDHRAALKTAGAVAIPQSYTKLMTFQKKGMPDVKACPCGYRQTVVSEGKGKVYHSQQWLDTFATNTPVDSPAPSAAPSDKCKALTKGGKPCCNKATASGYCKTHTATTNKGF